MRTSTTIQSVDLRRRASNDGDDFVEQRVQALNRLVTISFHPIWEWLIEAVIVISIFNAVYVVFFSSDDSNQLFYCLEVIFLVDTVIAYIHRFGVRNFSMNVPRRMIILLIDTLSLLPIYECCYIVFPQWATSRLQKHQQLKTLLRVVHLIETLFLEKFYSIKMNIVMLKITHMFILFLINLFLACWWSYEASCWPNCSEPNWSHSLRYLKELSLDKPIIWFLTCFTTIGDVLIHGSPGFLIDHNDTESFIILCALIIGFTTHSFYEIAHTFNNYVNVLKLRYSYKLHLQKLQFLFNSCGDDEETLELKSRTLTYYSVLWKKRQGIVFTQKIINELPFILTKEIMVDVFYDALMHSHLFPNLPDSLTRELCMCMETKYYLPGDCVFLPDQTYGNMLYLQSGIISVISHEDYHTPVLTLSSGTLIGESSLFMVHISNVMLKCATQCDVKLLPMASYNRLALLYHARFSEVHKAIRNRIKIARDRIPPKPIDNSLRFRTRCRSLKQQWRCVSAMHTYNLKHGFIDEQMTQPDKGFYSKYLDCIVLTDSDASNRNVICLKEKCPHVMNPDSSFRRFFIYIHLIVVVIHTIFLPSYYIFWGYIPDFLFLLNLILDLVFFFDIWLQSMCVEEVNNVKITNAKDLILIKFQKPKFLLDFFTALPYDYSAVFFGYSQATYFYLRLPRCIQWYKLIELILQLESVALKRPYLMMFCKYFIIYSSMVYLFMCYQYIFFNFGQNGIDQANAQLPITKHPVLNCFLYNLSAMLLMGLTENMATSIHGMLVYSLLTFIGCYVLNFCIVELSCNIVKSNETRYKHLKHYEAVNNFLISNSLAIKFSKAVSAYYGFLWHFNRNIKIKPIIEMPEYDIYIKNTIRILRQVPVFADFSDKLIELIAANAHVQMHPPGCELSHVNERNILFHVISKGYCSMDMFMSGDREKKRIQILKPGDCFNTLEAFHFLNSFNTVVTLTTVEVISISSSTIMTSLETDRKEMEIFKAALKWHREKYCTILNVNTLSDFLTVRQRQESQSKYVNYFEYVIDDNYDFDKENTEQHRLKKRLGFLHYLLLKNTIDPKHKYYIAWEIFRNLFAICYGFITFLSVTIMKEFYFCRFVFFIITEIVFFVDIYLRLHLQYYNKKNIKVTYLLSTMEHYIKTSMSLDVIALMALVQWPLYVGDTYQFTMNFIIATIYYISLFHRSVQGLVYIEQIYNDYRKHLATALRNLIIIFVAFALIGNNMLLAVCFENEKSIYNCTSTVNYISTSPFADYNDTLHLLIFHLHAVSERIHSDIVGVSEYPLMNNIMESVCVNIILWCFKLYLMSKMISSTIAGNAVILNKAKTKFNNFSNFVKHENISEKTVEEVKEHFEYVNTKNEGRSINSLLSLLTTKMRLDIKKQLFSKTLKKTAFFRKFELSALRVFTDLFDMRYYKIHAEIIRCNDVQSNIYVVSKGSVDIVVAADTLTTLTPGGAFGCFHENGTTRQTILARCNVHVELLVLDSTTFFKNLAPYPSLLDIFRSQMKHNIEYINSSVTVVDLSGGNSSGMTKLNRVTFACWAFYNKFNKYINLRRKSYKRYTIMVIHIAALSSIMLIVLMFLQKYLILATYCYICDLFFWANIIIMFHMQYIDPETGIRITNPNLIRKRYAKSLAFWVTLLGTLPIEIIPQIAGADTFVVECFFSNRLLRFALAMNYNQELNKKLSFSKWFQWLYIIYLLMFQIGCMTLIWYTFACNFQTCMHRVSTGPIKEMGVTGDRNEILLSLLYVVILFTAAGVRTVSSITITQLTVTVLISNASLVITSIMIGVLASLLLIKDSAANRYKTKVERMKLYFKSLDVSPYLREKIYDAMVLLWMKRRGELLPKIVMDAPGYIQQNVMMSLYGSHLSFHPLFKRMHLDMVRQMCVHFELGLYPAEQLIVDKGSCDDCMYFLHRGQIKVVYDSKESYIASSGYAFGEEQGIYGLPHKHTYIAYTTIDLLILKKSAWEYLLKWFPASKEIIATSSLLYCKEEDYNLEEQDILID